MEGLKLENNVGEKLEIYEVWGCQRIEIGWTNYHLGLTLNKDQAKQIVEHLTKVFELNEDKTEGLSDDKIDQAEQRMNVIGQNGNDGLHYQFWEQINNDLFNKDRLTDSNDPNDKTGIDY